MYYIYFWCLFSAWKLLPNKRLSSGDWFVISGVTAFISPKAFWRLAVEKYELQQSNGSWQKEGWVINSLPARQGCSLLSHLLPGILSAKSHWPWCPGRTQGYQDGKSIIPIAAEPTREHWGQTACLELGNSVVFQDDPKMGWLFRSQCSPWADGSWGGRCPAGGCVGSRSCTQASQSSYATAEIPGFFLLLMCPRHWAGSNGKKLSVCLRAGTAEAAGPEGGWDWRPFCSICILREQRLWEEENTFRTKCKSTCSKRGSTLPGESCSLLFWGQGTRQGPSARAEEEEAKGIG